MKCIASGTFYKKAMLIQLLCQLIGCFVKKKADFL